MAPGMKEPSTWNSRARTSPPESLLPILKHELVCQRVWTSAYFEAMGIVLSLGRAAGTQRDEQRQDNKEITSYGAS